MNTKQAHEANNTELAQSPGNAENTNSKGWTSRKGWSIAWENEINVMWKNEDTPFSVLVEKSEEHEEEYTTNFVMLGNYKVDHKPNLMEAWEEAEKVNWRKITQLVTLGIESSKTQE